MMLLQPQRPAPARSGVASANYGRKNSSVASFTSSSNDGYDPEGSRGTSMYHSQSGSSHQPGYFDPHSSPHSNQLRLPSTTDESSDAEYTKFASQGRRRGSVTKPKTVSHDSKLTKDGKASTKSSGGVGTLRGLGRRLFNRSSSNLKAAPLLASRSQSASSSSTSAQSPPLTPTTPPQVQPVWLPNGQKDFFANFSGLPSSVNIADTQSHNLRTPSDAFTGISPKTRQGTFSDRRSSHEDGGDITFDANSSQGHGSNSTFSHHSSAFALPSLPSATAAPPAFSSNVARREIPAVIEEEGDSDFLRAVLNFGEGDDGSLSTPSFRGGRAAPLPTRSSSLGQIAGIAASPSSFNTPSPRPPPRRTTDGRVILTQEAARDFATEKPTPSYVVVHRKYRKGLFGNESESEDEYGNDEEDDDAETTVVAPSAKSTVSFAETQAGVPGPSRSDEAARYPSSFSKARTRSQSNDDSATATRPPGLDSAAKKALYNCTLLKVHMHLAPTLAGDAEARSQIPVIAAGEMLYANDDLRFPRSINPEMKLRRHSSTYAFSRNLHVALARTEVMRKLRRDKLRIEDEVEISWFQRRYGSASIAPEQIAKALRQRQMVSPEALAKPPIAAPQDSAVGSTGGLAASRRLSGIVGLEPGQKGEKNGIISWAQRPGFLARTVVLLPAEEFAPGEVLVSGAAKLGERDSATSTVSFSSRIRVLAGLPSVEEERRIRYPMVTTKKFRPRDMQSKRASRLGSASDGVVWEGPDRRSSTRPARESPLASPSSKQKRLPPWMAPRSPQLLSPSMPQLRPPRAASEGQTAFSTLHQNSSTASIPEVKETEEQEGDSSDEEVPLAQLQNFRAQRAAEKERIQKLENEVAVLRQKEVEREKEEEERKTREEEARRIEAERAYEERKAAVEARRLEKNRRILQEARDRRGFTRQSVLLAEPNYGAGNPLLGHSRPKQGSSPSSPNLALEPISAGTGSSSRDAALAKLQGGNQIASGSTTSLYIQQDGQRRSKTSVVAQPEAAISPVTSPRIRSSATAASPLVDLHRQNSMATLSPPSQTIPHRRSMAQLPTSPQITQRRTSLVPAELHHATSMHHLAQPLFPPGGGMMHDPRHSMSMSNLHAQAYYQQQQQMALQRPNMVAQAQTQGIAGRISTRQRPGLAPLVSLYGDVLPSSAVQRRS
ncbi:uncharacterized protein UTRI_00472 [Ustilago trichophora]|uniref:Uncharacterized protein n=1 Tax=Ustilago trichophora TaxID=86804 RepID=A0A5C3DRL8_9BASI|nr:uncharacterized protein UTRI_00472 [Ustilago trichophora]